MWRCIGLILLAGMGCNWVFGLGGTVLEPPIDADRADADPRADLDRDGIKDVEDPCISPVADALVDSDNDGVANGVDACPFDASHGGDADGDGVPDACDPFAAPGDRVRCVMVLTDPDMNVQMWRPRDTPTPPWTLDTPRVIYGSAGSIAADWPFEAPGTTTYDIWGNIYRPSTGPFAALARAAAAPSSSDVGCELLAGASSWSLAIVPGRLGAVPVQTPNVSSAFRMRITIAPQHAGSPNVRCTLRLGTGATYTTTASVLPLVGGHLGFSAMTGGSIYGIAIYERDDAPPL